VEREECRGPCTKERAQHADDCGGEFGYMRTGEQLKALNQAGQYQSVLKTCAERLNVRTALTKPVPGNEEPEQREPGGAEVGW
jgi:hypothetical protein